MALTDVDRTWLESHFKEIREESARHWKFSTSIERKVDLHIQKSDTTHQAPCATAQAEMKAHLDTSHNLTAKAKTLGVWAGMTAGLAEAIHWIHEYFKKG